jgi:ketosteroid isomerase-like protein
VAAENAVLIEALERQWRDALCAKDMDRLRELIHPDFVLIGTRSSGSFTMRRDEWLDAIQRREVVDIKIGVQDASVFDEVMVGTVHARWLVRYLGKEFDDCVLLTDVWVCDDERWRVIRRHSTPLPSNECLAI